MREEKLSINKNQQILFLLDKKLLKWERKLGKKRNKAFKKKNLIWDKELQDNKYDFYWSCIF